MSLTKLFALGMIAATLVATACGGDDENAGKNGGSSSGGPTGTDPNAPGVDPIGVTPVTGHPRLLVRPDDLDRLRSWATSDNPIYTSIRELADKAKQRMDAGEPASDDDGGPTGTPLATETFAELFAFMSLIAPEAERDDWGKRAQTLLMSIMNEAVKGPAKNQKFRDPAFAIDDRSRWNGTGFALTVDWIYGRLSAQEKETIRTVFLRWSDEIMKATTTTANHPEPVGVINDPKLLADKENVRWSANNYYAAHIRNLGLMAMSFDPADDPEEKLRGYLANCAGAWLYVSDALMRGDMAGGLGAEGFQYSPQSLGYVTELLAALYTAGRADPKLLGEQVTFSNPFWNAVGPAYIHSLSPSTSGTGQNEIYHLASYGDLGDSEADGMIGVFGALGVRDYLAKDQKRLNMDRWIEAYVPLGGIGELPFRARATDSYIDAILHFLLFEPKAQITDPRPELPLTHFAPGLGRILARTDWSTNATWFTYKLSWATIDHQQADANMFELWRKGEWLTRGRAGYGFEIGMSDYKNSLSLQNDVPAHNDGYRGLAYQRGSQWPFVASGDPKLLAQSSTPGAKYTYALGETTNLYNSTGEGSTDIVHASRSIVWLAPDRVITYDRATSKKTNRFKRYWVNLPAQGTVAGNLVTTTTPKGQKLFVRSLMPEGGAISVEAVEALADQRETDDPIKFRVKVEAPGGPTNARFLHLIQGADGGGAADNATLIHGSGGTPFDGVAASNVVVMFPVDIGNVTTMSYTAPAGVTAHVITGLTPNTGYSANVAGNNVTVSAGGGQMTDAGGVLVIGTL